MTIYICGDSTAASYTPEQAPITGWGQVLSEFLPGVRVENRAMGGRSTKSFLSEGRLQRIETEIQPGDLLLIQFTHNDTSDLVWRHTDPWTSFYHNLEIYVDTAMLHRARPVLMTPICRRYWRDGQLLETHGDYPNVIRALAAQRNVPLIDIGEQETVHVRGARRLSRLSRRPDRRYPHPPPRRGGLCPHDGGSVETNGIGRQSIKKCAECRVQSADSFV